MWSCVLRGVGSGGNSVCLCFCWLINFRICVEMARRQGWTDASGQRPERRDRHGVLFITFEEYKRTKTWGLAYYFPSHRRPPASFTASTISNATASSDKISGPFRSGLPRRPCPSGGASNNNPPSSVCCSQCPRASTTISEMSFRTKGGYLLKVAMFPKSV